MVEVRGRVHGTTQTLSPIQQLFWITEARYQSAAAHAGLVLDIRGALDVAALRSALTTIVRHHPALRTCFGEHDGEVRAVVLDDVEVELVERTISEAELAALLREEPRRRFDLGCAPLLRLTLARTEPQRHHLICVFHHLVTDGTSMWQLFVEELADLYAAARSGGALTLPTSLATYQDFADASRREHEGRALERHQAFWREELSGRPPLLTLPLDRPRAARPSGEGGRVERSLALPIRRAIHIVASSLGVRPLDILLAAWSTLLARASGTTDLVVGVPHANRAPELRTVHGCFADTSVVRVDLGGSPTFSELARRIAARRWRARPHRSFSSGALLEALSQPGDPAHRPIYQVMFNYLDISPADARLEELEVRGAALDCGAALADLSLDAFDQADGVHLILEYDRDLFEEITARRFLARLDALLEAALERPEHPISELPLLGEDERRALLVDFQGPPLEAAPDTSLGARLWAEAETHATRTALIAPQLTLDYRDLFARATHVASALRSAGVIAGDVVAVELLDRGAAVVAILGVLGAGAAYLPIDPDVPEARADEMIRGAGARVILTEPARRRLRPRGALVLGVDPLETAPAPLFVGLDATPDDPAYVLFTSGSTGAAKGVVIDNANVLHQLQSRMSAYPGPPSVFLLSYALGFDAAVAGLFWTLATGGTVVVVAEAARKDPRAIVAHIRAHRPSHLDFVPTLYAAVLSEARPGDLDGVHTVTLGGEPLVPALVERHFAQAAHARLFNEYGPTETTVFSTVHEVRPTDSGVSIGRLAAGVRGYVLDESRALVPIGQPGELYLGGGGLARGYVGRPDLTAEAFVDDPFVMGRRLYKSGDRVRWNADGTLQFVGRMDRQVKLRGFRVELGEVEARLSRHPGVDRAVVEMMDGPGGAPLLSAYWVGTESSEDELRRYVSAHLPAHMVPTAWVQLAALPLGPTGKVDRHSLPAPTLRRSRSGRAPTTETERQVAELWCEVLRVQRAHLDDDFFEQGGHSLLAVKLLARIACVFERVVPMVMLFENPTLGALAHQLESTEPEPAALRALERIRPQGHRRPLFFVGSTSQARALTEHLDVTRPVYGLNIFGLYPGAEQSPSTPELADIARAYIEELRCVQTHGPYMLLGYCAEAGLALEMAVQLDAVGESVGFLGLIDGLPYVELSESRPSRVMRNLMSDRWQYVTHLVRRRRRMWSEWSEHLLGRWERQVAVVERRPVSLVAQHLGWVEAYQQAMARYRPASVEARLTLFLTTEVGDVDLTSLCSLARGGVDLERVRAYHDNLFEAPHVARLGTLVEKAIHRAEL